MAAAILIGTSGWHYQDWIGSFYPADIIGYNELRFHAQHFSTVENNSSFYRIASQATYQTWDRMTPPGYKFSIKLNKLITHYHRLELTDEVIERIQYILETTAVLKDKRGAILVQLPASFHVDIQRLATFLHFFAKAVRAQDHPFDIAIEFRNKQWFTSETYDLLRKYNVALTAAQSSRYPGVRQQTADIAYIRFHGPEKLFASSYSNEALEDWANYINSLAATTRTIYVYFNNDFHGYAIANAKTLMQLLQVQPPENKL
ncbi:MAG TPA: DUF72 domain-containing protein [Verrucomicrobiae bacterium]|nr:DUF72 domain-containing protein [Verrucomicrobiae bacterium]